MKKYLALLLALAMVFTLAACGGSTGSTEAEAPAAEEAAPAAEETAAEAAPAVEEEAPADAAVEPLDIRFSTVYNETDTGGTMILKWIDLLEEYSDGAITVTPYWGGTLYGDADILEGLESGAIDMTTFGHMPHTATLNYLAFPAFAPGGTEGALEMFEEVCFNNPETSALVQGELAEHDILFLSILPGGANAFCAKYEFTDLQSLIDNSGAFGNMDGAVFEQLGFQVTSIGPMDCYDALQRGLIDSTQMALTPMVSLQWYDVAPYWALDGTYTAGNFISANMTWWNSLSDAQQDVIRRASEDVSDWSAELYNEAIDGDIATVEEITGNAFVQFSDEDIARVWAAVFDAKADAALSVAGANGKTEGMIKILQVCADMTGYDWQAPAN